MTLEFCFSLQTEISACWEPWQIVSILDSPGDERSRLTGLISKLKRF